MQERTENAEKKSTFDEGKKSTLTQKGGKSLATYYKAISVQSVFSGSRTPLGKNVKLVERKKFDV